METTRTETDRGYMRVAFPLMSNVNLFHNRFEVADDSPTNDPIFLSYPLANAVSPRFGLG